MLLIAGGMAGCVKASTPGSSNAISYVSIINEAPYGAAVDVYFNGTQVSPSGGIATGQYSSAYGSLKAGTYTVDFKKAGTDSLIYELPSADYDTSAFYTLLLYNVNIDSTAVQAARIQDNFSAVGTSSTYYRFFNLSPDIPNANLLLNNQIVQSNRSPADNIIPDTNYNAFAAMPPGSYTIKIENAMTDSTLTSSPALPLRQGDVYTIFLAGTLQSGLTVNVLQAIY